MNDEKQEIPASPSRPPNVLKLVSAGMTISLLTHPSLILFQENGLTFKADTVNGQQTGFFLNQCNNRMRVDKFFFVNKTCRLLCIEQTARFILFLINSISREPE